MENQKSTDEKNKYRDKKNHTIAVFILVGIFPFSPKVQFFTAATIVCMYARVCEYTQVCIHTHLFNHEPIMDIKVVNDTSKTKTISNLIYLAFSQGESRLGCLR